MEEQAQEKLWLMQIANFGRSPGDKREASQMTSMWSDMVRAIRDSTPWVEEERKRKIRERLKKPPRPSVSIKGDIPEEARRALSPLKLDD